MIYLCLLSEFKKIVYRPKETDYILFLYFLQFFFLSISPRGNWGDLMLQGHINRQILWTCLHSAHLVTARPHCLSTNRVHGTRWHHSAGKLESPPIDVWPLRLRTTDPHKSQSEAISLVERPKCNITSRTISVYVSQLIDENKSPNYQEQWSLLK